MEAINNKLATFRLTWVLTLVSLVRYEAVVLTMGPLSMHSPTMMFLNVQGMVLTTYGAFGGMWMMQQSLTCLLPSLGNVP